MRDRFWAPFVGTEAWPGGEILDALVAKFVSRVDVVDREAFTAATAGPCLYLANHQVTLESLLFVLCVSPLAGRPIAALAKSEHRAGWLGALLDLCFAHPGVRDPGFFLYFDRLDPDPEQLFSLARGHDGSVLIHVEGTRRRTARRAVKRLSPLWIDLALHHQWPVVPVRFIGGLPVDDPGVSQELPVSYGTQTIRVGRPITPRALAALPPLARLTRVRQAINDLSDARHENPEVSDEEFGTAVSSWMARTGVDANTAAVYCALRRLPAPSATIRAVLTGDAPGATDPWVSQARRYFGA